MAMMVAILVFAGALAFTIWAIRATLSDRREVILALLTGKPDPRFVARPARRIGVRPAPVRVRYSSSKGSPEWRAAA